MRPTETGWSHAPDALGVADMVTFQSRYLDVDALSSLAASADVVILPYDSREQVTSGVLIEAVTAHRPVIATAFAHAVELLASGAGIVVDHDDPERHGRRHPPRAVRAGAGRQHGHAGRRARP